MRGTSSLKERGALKKTHSATSTEHKAFKCQKAGSPPIPAKTLHLRKIGKQPGILRVQSKQAGGSLNTISSSIDGLEEAR